jgi:tricorn protease
VAANKFVESFGLSPGGERAVFGARGEIFTVPAKDGEPRNVSATPDAREHSVSWSPGWQVDRLPERCQRRIRDLPARPGWQPSRVASPPTATSGASAGVVTRWQARVRRQEAAPAGRRGRQRQALTEWTSSPTRIPETYLVARQPLAGLRAKTNASRNTSIWLYSLEARPHASSRPTTAARPARPSIRRAATCISSRTATTTSTFSSYEFNFLYTNATRLYAATLAADGPALYRPLSDEVGAGEEKKDGNGKSDEKAAPKPLRIDLPGFNQRVIALNAPPGNYVGLSANEAGVFYMALSDGGPGELRFLSLDAEAKPEAVGPAQGYALSHDGSKLLLRRGDDYAIVDAKPKADFDAGKLDLAHMQLRIEPTREWRQLYVDGWRILRDWFYDAGMHGQDWNAIRAKYEALLPHVANRADLDYLLQEIAGEANAGHVYVESGDEPKPERAAGGLLGAELAAHESGYVRIAHIFPSENWNPALRSPLTEPGVNVAEGEFLLAVDNVSTRGVDNVYRLFENDADRVVTLRVNASPQEAGAREVRVRTIASELGLRYLDWVQQRRRMVERLSDGRIGYIHVPNTAVEGSRELFKGLLAYSAKDALIIDDRYNGGGFIPDRLIELLSRQPLNYWKQRGLEPNPTPLLHHRGPKAMLINGLSSSGGDALPYYFRKLGLGKLFGTRTWGGLIGISGNPRLADNGIVLAATFSFMDTEGKWAVENEGVAPDVEVIDRPEAIAAGRDPSLEAAVQHLLHELEARPPRAVVAPPAPTQFPPEA